MANWNLPTTTSNYLDFVTEINTKFVDTASMFGFAVTNQPVGAIRFNRGGAGYNIDEWDGTTWQPRFISLISGGTGSNTAAGARTNLGIGTMGTQNSNAVNITGGSITGVQYSAADITSGVLPLARGGTGNSLAIATPGAILMSNGVVVYFDTGINIPQLNASNLASGTVPAARLSNVGFLNATQNWTGGNSFLGQFAVAESIYINGGYPGFYLQNSTGAVNKHRLYFFNYLGDFYIQAQNDDATFAANLFSVTNAGVLVGNGAEISNINAAYIANGTINPARLGSGVANSTTVLYGDNVWRAPGGGGGSGIPSGLIAMFDTNCPAGWTRVASMDNRMPIGSTVFGGLGGSANHYHSIGFNTSNGGAHGHSFNGSGSFSGRTGDSNNNAFPTTEHEGNGSAMEHIDTRHTHPFSGSVDIGGNTSNVGDHSHQVSGNSSTESNYPPYIGVVFCRKD